MVTKWGLSDQLGPLTYAEEDGEVFLGRSVTQHKKVSDGTAHAIDEEVRRVIDSNYDHARSRSCRRNLDKLHTMAEALIKYETIDESRSRTSWPGCEPKPPEGWDDSVGRPAASRPCERTPVPIGSSRRSALTARVSTEQARRPPAAAAASCGMRAANIAALAEPVVMGVLNVTPDSFTDGGQFLDPARALERALAMVARARTSSTSAASRRGPGPPRSRVEEEMRRVVPVVAALAAPNAAR